MKRKKTGWVVLLSATLLIIVLLVLDWRTLQIKNKITAARRSLPEVLDSILQNKYINRHAALIVCFVSTDCDHCQSLCAQIAIHLNDLETAQIILITDQNQKLTNEFVSQIGFTTVRNLFILPDSLGSWRNLLGIQRLPTTWVYDRQNNLIRSFIGEVEFGNILKAANEH